MHDETSGVDAAFPDNNVQKRDTSMVFRDAVFLFRVVQFVVV